MVRTHERCDHASDVQYESGYVGVTYLFDLNIQFYWTLFAGLCDAVHNGLGSDSKVEMVGAYVPCVRRAVRVGLCRGHIFNFIGLYFQDCVTLFTMASAPTVKLKWLENMNAASDVQCKSSYVGVTYCNVRPCAVIRNITIFNIIGLYLQDCVTLFTMASAPAVKLKWLENMNAAWVMSGIFSTCPPEQ